MTSRGNTSLDLYNYIINDVTSDITDIFTEESIDVQVIQELKSLWVSKLLACVKQDETTQYKPKILLHDLKIEPKQEPNIEIPVVNQNMTGIPIKITTSYGDTTRSLIMTIQENLFDPEKVKEIVTGQLITATIGLPTQIAENFLTNYVNKELTRMKLSSGLQPTMPQLDGTSDEDEESIDSENGLLDIYVDDNLVTNHSETASLNSEDDVTDEDEDLFETNNIVVCQFEKVMRKRNKWKFYLKHGIMSLNGKEFVFDKLDGKTVW